MGEWTIHGGRLEAARATWPDAPMPWIDLSTGLNPHSWPMERAGPIDWRRLPDDATLAALEEAAAQSFGVDPAWVCATPGSEIALRLLGTAGLPAPARHVAPGYRTHAEAFPESIATPPEAIGAVRDGTLLLANPANPQGSIRDLRTLADDLAARGGQLIVDEAFADATPGASLLPHPSAIVLRSFGKFYGLAGVRLGFIIAAPDRLSSLRARLGSWPVSAAAIAIGTAAYRDVAWQTDMRSRLSEECAALDIVLRRHGLTTEGECPLFRLVRTDNAAVLFERLARHGMLTRPFDYAPDWLRIGLPDGAEALHRLDRALTHD